MFKICFYGVVVITSASHAEGPQFNPGWKQILTMEYVIVIHIYFINSVSSNGPRSTPIKWPIKSIVSSFLLKNKIPTKTCFFFFNDHLLFRDYLGFDFLISRIFFSFFFFSFKLFNSETEKKSFLFVDWLVRCPLVSISINFVPHCHFR